jgi:hypothetical protein
MTRFQNFLILFITLLMWSCEGKKTSKEQEVSSDKYELVESVSSNTENVEADINTITADLKTEKRNEIPKSYHAFLSLDEHGAYYLLIPTKKIDDFYFFALYQQNPPTPILSPYELSFFIIQDGELKQKTKFDIGIYSELDVSMHHEHFISIRDWVTEYEENEAGIMEEKGESYEKIGFISLLNGKPKMIADLKNDELRIARNYIFARYGRKFQSVDLQEYFTQFDWYEAKLENVDDQLTDLDKELLRQLVLLENK